MAYVNMDNRSVVEKVWRNYWPKNKERENIAYLSYISKHLRSLIKLFLRPFPERLLIKLLGDYFLVSGSKKAGMKDRWLIISYFANIDAMAPSHHIDDRLPVFRQKGIEVYILTSPCGPKYDKDIRHARIFSPAPSGIRYEVRHILRRYTRKRFWFKFLETLLLLPLYPFYLIEKLFLRLDSTWSWFITATIMAIILFIKYRPSIIYSTGGPVSAHIAAMVTSRITGIPHIAEFQDPLVHQYAAPGRFERHFIKKVEAVVLKKVAASVFLTQKAAQNAKKRNPKTIKITNIYAGAVPHKKGILPYKRDERFIIAHFGSLGGSRNLDYIFMALTKLLHEYPELKKCIRLELYGNSSKMIRRQIEQFPIKEILNVIGKVNRQKAIDSMQKADVLLLIQNIDDVSFETIPSKVYEYLHSGRPILALVYRNHELQAMLEAAGHIVVQADDEDAIKNAIETYIDRWMNNDLEFKDFKISPYTVENAVNELISLSNSVRNDPRC